VHTVVETRFYLAAAEENRLSAEEREHVVSFIAADPRCGDLIPGTGGARKVRFAGRGKGKSGGYRVVTYFGGDDVPVFLLDVYGKGRKADISPRERNELRAVLALIAEAWRLSAKEAAAGRRDP